MGITLETFTLLLNKEDDDESDEQESAPADVTVKSEVDRNDFIAAANMDNFELLHNSTLHIYRSHESFEYAENMVASFDLQKSWGFLLLLFQNQHKLS
ncbi:hypothetical protein OIU84_027073, partial [Salix udensis]